MIEASSTSAPKRLRMTSVRIARIKSPLGQNEFADRARFRGEQRRQQYGRVVLLDHGGSLDDRPSDEIAPQIDRHVFHHLPLEREPSSLFDGGRGAIRESGPAGAFRLRKMADYPHPQSDVLN